MLLAKNKPKYVFRKRWVGKNKNSIPPRPMGRKPRNNDFELTEEVLTKITNYAARGMNKEQIAYCLDISPKTLERKAKADPELEVQLDEAIKKGRSRGIALISNASFEYAQDARGVADRIFWLKNHAGWRDTQHSEVTGKGGQPLIPRKEYSDEERAIRLASILSAIEQRVKKTGGKLPVKKLRIRKGATVGADP